MKTIKWLSAFLALSFLVLAVVAPHPVAAPFASYAAGMWVANLLWVVLVDEASGDA